MARALASACLVLVLCLGGTAWAKPKIAILGLEAAPGPSGAVDPAMTQIARAITKELRQRAQGASSPYGLAPNSSKELTDEKLLMSCDNEAASCMAQIGAGLAAEVLLYGRVEKRGGLYRVTLKRLDVKTRAIDAAGEELPVGSAVAGMAKRLYVQLVGEAQVVGTLVIQAASPTGAPIGAGTVMVDETPRGTLAAGRASVTGLAEGRHVVAIEAGGYGRFEETVTIRAGAQATLAAVLRARGATDDPARSGGSRTAWKATLGASLAVGVVGGGLAAYSFYRMSGEDVTADRDPDSMVPASEVTSDDCGLTPGQIKTRKHAIVNNPDVFAAACRWRSRIYYGFGVAGVGAIGAVISVVMLTRNPGAPERSRTSTRGKKPEVALTPIVTPSLAGAALSVAW